MLAANAEGRAVVGSNPTEGKICFSHFTLLQWNVKNCFVKLTRKNYRHRNIITIGLAPLVTVGVITIGYGPMLRTDHMGVCVCVYY